jgi:hypothetical protein
MCIKEREKMKKKNERERKKEKSKQEGNVIITSVSLTRVYIFHK